MEIIVVDTKEEFNNIATALMTAGFMPVVAYLGPLKEWQNIYSDGKTEVNLIEML